MEKEEFQVYYKGRYLDTVFETNGEKAQLRVAMSLSITKIPINKINSNDSDSKENLPS